MIDSWFDGFSRIQCNCGDYPKDHYGGAGFCRAKECGCTWYYPNDKYISKMKEAGFTKLSQVEEYRRWKCDKNKRA